MSPQGLKAPESRTATSRLKKTLTSEVLPLHHEHSISTAGGGSKGGLSASSAADYAGGRRPRGSSMNSNASSSGQAEEGRQPLSRSGCSDIELAVVDRLMRPKSASSRHLGDTARCSHIQKRYERASGVPRAVPRLRVSHLLRSFFRQYIRTAIIPCSGESGASPGRH